MLAVSQSDGTTPVIRDFLKISVKSGAISSTAHPDLKSFLHQGPSTVLTLLPG